MELSFWSWDDGYEMDRAAARLNCHNTRKVFQIAGESRHIPQESIDKDYNLYQVFAIMPGYVKDLIRSI